VVIEGPRFSTLAESMMYINQGWDVINMTQYPECYLAREYGMNYAAITSITDYNVGLQQIEHEITPSGYSKVKNLFKKNAKSSQKILLALVSKQDQILAIPKVSVTFKEFFRK
jgi:5'-methylthioadenosine phosphorylase